MSFFYQIDYMKRALLTTISVIAILLAVSTKARANSEYNYYEKRQSIIEVFSASDTLTTITKNIANDTVMQLYAVDEFPRFEQCKDATKEENQQCFQQHMHQHILYNFSYPDLALENGIQGRVNVLFKINTDGKVEILDVIGEHQILNNKAREIIEKLPLFTPAKHKGIPVSVSYSQPIRFMLK